MDRQTVYTQTDQDQTLHRCHCAIGQRTVCLLSHDSLKKDILDVARVVLCYLCTHSFIHIISEMASLVQTPGYIHVQHSFAGKDMVERTMLVLATSLQRQKVFRRCTVPRSNLPRISSRHDMEGIPFQEWMRYPGRWASLRCHQQSHDIPHEHRHSEWLTNERGFHFVDNGEENALDDILISEFWWFRLGIQKTSSRTRFCNDTGQVWIWQSLSGLLEL